MRMTPGESESGSCDLSKIVYAFVRKGIGALTCARIEAERERTPLPPDDNPASKCAKCPAHVYKIYTGRRPGGRNKEGSSKAFKVKRLPAAYRNKFNRIGCSYGSSTENPAPAFVIAVAGAAGRAAGGPAFRLGSQLYTRT